MDLPSNDIRSKEIFLRAIELEGDERGAFVAAECAGDPELNRLISELLRHHQTDTVLDLRQGSLSTESNRGAIDRLQPVLHFLTFLAGTRKRRLIVYAVCAAASLLAGWLVRERAHELTRGNALSVVNAVAEASASYVSSMFKEWTRDAETAVAENHGRDAALAAIRKPNPEAWRRFDSYASRALEGGEFSGYELADPHGVIIRGRNHDYEGMMPTEAGAALVSEIDSTKRPVVRILGVHRMIRSIVGDGSLVPSLLIMTPVLDEKGGMAGIYMEAKPLASLAEMLRHTRMIATAETYLFTSEGQMITPSRFLDDMRRWGLVYEPKISIAAPFVMLRDPGRALRESHGLRPGEDPSTWPNTEVYRIASAAAADPAKPRAGLIAEPYRDYRGEKVVGAWRWLSDYNLGLVTEVDEAEINGVPALVDRFMLALLLITGLAGTWTLISSGWLLRLGAEVSRRESMGQYTLVQKIGEGGMGEVYLARHPLLKRMSALKVLRRDQTGSVPEALFENEVQIASRLVHPNTVEIYDYGCTRDGTFYYVMQYLPGKDLGALVAARGAMPAARVIHIARQICGALAEAHGQGLLHSDVKPSNVMVCALAGVYDFAKLLDFGIARKIRPDTEDSGRGVRSGTPYFTAPELLTGAESADGRADIYSLGVLCFYLLEACLPFPAGLPWVEAVSIQRRLSPACSPAVPRELSELVMSCMELDPALRPDGAGDLLMRLERLATLFPWSNEDARAAWANTAVSQS